MHISLESCTFVASKATKMMKFRIFCIVLLVSACRLLSMAQEYRNTMPDLQTAEPDFFDPTRKEDIKEAYVFSAPWRIEVGYAQSNQRTQDTSAVYLHGLRLGATIDFILPYNFSIQTGALATFTYGQNNQHWPSMGEDDAQINILQHNILQLQLTIPARAYYNIKLWKELRMVVHCDKPGHKQLCFHTYRTLSAPLRIPAVTAPDEVQIHH